MAKKVLVPISDGFEEIEASTIIDVLRRAELDVTVAALGELSVTGRSNIMFRADCNLDEALQSGPYDMTVLPGGLPNAYTLRDDKRIQKALADAHEEKRYVAAICAAPAALEKAGLLEGARATNYPGVRSDLSQETYVEEDVVEWNNIITSRGPGTAMRFALVLVRILAGSEVANRVAEDLLADVQV